MCTSVAINSSFHKLFSKPKKWATVIIVFYNVNPIFVNNFIKVRLWHHLLDFVKTIMQFTINHLDVMIMDHRIQVNAYLLLVLEFINMNIRHFHLFCVDRLVIRPVIFLKMLNGHKLLSSPCYSRLSDDTHCIV